MAKKFLTGLNLVVLDTDPATGSEGELYFNSSASVAKIYQAGAWSVLGAGGGDGSNVTVSSTEPVSPVIGDVWYKNDTGELYIFDGTYWVEVNGVIDGVHTYYQASEPIGAAVGDIWVDSDATVAYDAAGLFLDQLPGSLIPDMDNVYSVGASAYRWKDIFIGPGSFYITDQTLLTQTAITVDNGVFNIDGIAQAQLPSLKVEEIVFDDDTVQTTAYRGTSSFGGYYGSFYDTTTLSLTSATTAYPLPLNTTAEANGTSIASGSRITVANAGVYNIQFSAQLDKTDSANDVVNIWFAKNGTNIANSNTQVTVLGNNGKYLASWNFVLTLAANDYVQIMIQSPDTNMRVVASGTQTSPDRPAVPSSIVTITQVR